MKIVMLTDLHGRIDLIPSLAEVFKSSDLVVLAGDITHFGNSVQVENILNAIKQFQANILTVSGNCDPSEIENYLVNAGISLHARCMIRDNICFAGLSGSLPCPAITPHEYNEIEFTSFLDEINSSRKSLLPMLLISHQPPFNCKNDQLPSGIHVGSHAIRNYIENESPILCLCGHIHEGIGIDNIGKTMTINPGPFRAGHYAIITILPEKIEAELF